MALAVCQNYEKKIMKIDEVTKSSSKELMKMNHKILHLVDVGLPNLAKLDDML